MRSIQFTGNDNLSYELEISEKLIDVISQQRGLGREDVTDDEVIKFFVEAAGQAFDRAAVEYLANDAKAS